MSRKLIVIIVIAALAIAGFFGGRYFAGMAKYKNIISGIEIRTPDIMRIQDGVYNGTFDAVFIFADLDVVVNGGRITEILINEHYNDRGATAEAILDDVIVRQTLDVDTVSGATNSSKVLLKALENALINEAA
jgi:uncharacterized protein with FMN-binding domain